MTTEVLSDHLCQLIEAVSHHVIGKRKIYPDTIFTSRLAFGVPVKYSMHPGVNEFIESALDSLMAAIDAKKAKVHGLNLLILDKDEDLVEKYVFAFPRMKFKYKNLKTGVTTAKQKFKAPLDVADVMRNILIRLTSRMDEMPPLDKAAECTFNYSLITNVEAARAIEHRKPDAPWEATGLKESEGMEFLAEKIPIQAAKHNAINLALHIDIFNRELMKS